MNRRFYGWVVIGALALAGCDAGYPNDVADSQDYVRANRDAPRDTELPPGLGADLPDSPIITPSTTQPVSSIK